MRAQADQRGFLPLKKIVTGISEEKLWRGQPCLTPVSVEVPEAKGSAALCPTALVPTGHLDKSPLLEGHPAHHSSVRSIAAGLSCLSLPPRHRGLLIPPNSSQVWKQSTIICHYGFWFLAFFKDIRKEKHSCAFTGNAVFPLLASQDKLKHLLSTLAEHAWPFS